MKYKHIKLYKIKEKKREMYNTKTILTLNLLTTTIVAPPINVSKWQMGFNSVFEGLKFLK